MEFQIDRSNEERSPVASTINQSVSNIKSDLEHGALGFRAQNLPSLVQWHITSMHNAVSAYPSSHSYFGFDIHSTFNLDTGLKAHLQLPDCGSSCKFQRSQYDRLPVAERLQSISE
jgi:hypothetical protein